MANQALMSKVIQIKIQADDDRRHDVEARADADHCFDRNEAGTEDNGVGRGRDGQHEGEGCAHGRRQHQQHRFIVQIDREPSHNGQRVRLALSYYTREVYFTADIDLAYADREALDEVLRELGFVKKGRYWTHTGLDIAVEAPAAALAGEDARRETVELEGGLFCVVIGLEDLIIGTQYLLPNFLYSCRQKVGKISETFRFFPKFSKTVEFSLFELAYLYI